MKIAILAGIISILIVVIISLGVNLGKANITIKELRNELSERSW